MTQSGQLARQSFHCAIVLHAGLSLAAPAEPAGRWDGFDEVVSYHVARYPAMEIRDLYKLVFQAAMGSEHAVPGRQAAADWLGRELASLSEIPDEAFTEPLSADGSLIRVNLRGFVARGGSEARLLDAFLGTAAEFSPSRERLTRYWRCAEEMGRSGRIPFADAELREFWQRMQAAGFPAVHHSVTYRDRYQPAYRVVLRELLDPASGRRTAD